MLPPRSTLGPDLVRPPLLGPVGVGALAWLLAFTAWSATAPPLETTFEVFVDDGALLPVRIAAAVVAGLIAARGSLDRTARFAFAALAVSFALGSVSNLLRVLRLDGAPLPPAIALGVAVPQGLALLAGLWSLARLRRDDRGITEWLDSAAIVVALFLLAAHFIAGGNPFASYHLGARRWLFLLYLTADILAVFFAATAWFRRPPGISRTALSLLTLGFAVAAVADLVFDQQLQRGSWRNGGALDAVVTLAFVLLLLGLDRQRRHRAGIAEPASAHRSRRHVIAPVAIAASTLPMLQLAWGDPDRASHLAFHVTGVVLLLVLVLARQHIARDELLRLSRERMAADARFRSLVQRSSDAILQASTDHVIQWASPSAGEMAGTIPALLVGKRVTDLAHPGDRDRLATFLSNASQPFARNAAVRWRLGRPDQWHDVESVVNDLTADPDVRAIVLNTRDVSERVRLEQQLRQSQKLEAVGRLAGGIAHDFNNILAAIISHAQLVRESLPDGDAHVSDLQEIEQTAQRGAVLTRRLLSFSRPEVGELSPRSLTAVVRGMEPMLRRLLVGQVELTLDLGEEDLWIRAAEGQVEQVLMNLAINARDAMPDGGTVVVRLRPHTVRPGAAAEGELPGRWAELSVRDTGIGMDAETLARLFEPFFTTKPSGLGTGLGLTTVRGIVRTLGGQVFAASAPGQGATLRVLLPLATSTAVAEAPAPAPAPAAEPGRRVVLVVDDEVALRRAMKRLLEKSGYEVVGAASGPEALERLDARGWRVDLVITDMVMPRMGGRELVERIRLRNPALPVICMSGHMEWGAAADDDADAPWSPDRLLAKPFAFPEFLDRVRTALAGPAIEPTTAPRG